MPAVFSWERRVEFCETDAVGIAHFSSLMCYMEQAEHALLRSLGTSVVAHLDDDAQASQPGDSGWRLSWPRVHVECDYRGSARFEDLLRIDVCIVQLGTKSLTYGFEFWLNGASIATGKIVAVCCRVRPGDPLQSMAIPEGLRTSLTQFVQETPP